MTGSKRLEIGGDFSLEFEGLHNSENNVFDYLKDFNCIYTDTGRSALKLALKGSSGEVLLPEYICSSVIKCFCKYEIKFYKVGFDFQADENNLLGLITDKTKVIYLMHYFGSMQSPSLLFNIRKIADKVGAMIIEDSTHSLLTCPSSVGDLMICSLRKWGPAGRGGVLYSKHKIIGTSKLKEGKIGDRLTAMFLKEMYLNNETEDFQSYLHLFDRDESVIDKEDHVSLIPKLSALFFEFLNLKNIIKARNKNFSYLKEMLSKLDVEPACRYSDDGCPFVFPILASQRDLLRKHLAANNIFCAVHWPFDGISSDQRKNSAKISQHILSLPIDQRYNSVHMEFIARAIKSFKGRLHC